VFLLLIFFMVSMSFSRENHLAVALPEAKGEASTKESLPSITVSIDQAGRYAVDGQTMATADIQALMTMLQRLASGDPSQPVVVAADGKAPHSAVVTAMDAAGRLGFSRLRLAVQEPQETESDE